MNELWAAVIGAAVGSLTTYFGTWVQQGRERRQNRISRATVLLSELRNAEASMRDVYTSNAIGVIPAGTLEWLLSPSPDTLAVFQPTTVQQLVAFADHVRAVRAILDALAAGAKPTAQTGNWLKVSAAAAVWSVPELKQSLEGEGGVYVPTPFPEMSVMEPGATRPPDLPPSPFPTGGSRKATVVTSVRSRSSI